MERFSIKYHPIVEILIEDEAFGSSRFQISAHEGTSEIIEKHPTRVITENHKFFLAIVTQIKQEHRSLEDIVNPDFSLKEQIEHHSTVTYDYQKQHKEYSREVYQPLANQGTFEQDLTNHIFENNLLLKFQIQINPLFKDSLPPEDPNAPKLIFLDNIMSPNPLNREKTINILPREENGNSLWRIEEEEEAPIELTSLNLENNVLAECHVNITSHLTDLHSIKYHIKIKRKEINNP
jgi:hypothetical protein